MWQSQATLDVRRLRGPDCEDSGTDHKKTGRKWKVVEAVDEAKECLKIKEVIGQTQTDRKGLGSSTEKWWSKAEGKEKRDMVINEIYGSMKIPEGFRKQSSNLNRDNGLIGIMPCRNPSHGMRSGTSDQLSHQISVQSPALKCKSGTVGKEDPTCPLCQGRQTTEHVLSSCKIALSQGRYTWRHNRVLKELAAIISMAKGETTLPNTNALIFTTEEGAKSWHGRPVRTTNQIKCLLDGCDDWDVSADLPEWDSHPSIIKETRLRPDIVIHSASTQQLIMVELTVP